MSPAGMSSPPPPWWCKTQLVRHNSAQTTCGWVVVGDVRVCKLDGFLYKSVKACHPYKLGRVCGGGMSCGMALGKRVRTHRLDLNDVWEVQDMWRRAQCRMCGSRGVCGAVRRLPCMHAHALEPLPSLPSPTSPTPTRFKVNPAPHILQVHTSCACALPHTSAAQAHPAPSTTPAPCTTTAPAPYTTLQLPKHLASCPAHTSAAPAHPAPPTHRTPPAPHLLPLPPAPHSSCPSTSTSRPSSAPSALRRTSTAFTPSTSDDSA